MEALTKTARVAEMPMACRSCVVRDDGICGAMTDAQLAELCRNTIRRKVEHGAELHGQGERILFYANILKGVVKLTKRMRMDVNRLSACNFPPPLSVGRLPMRVS